jgi:hypothetical protein
VIVVTLELWPGGRSEGSQVLGKAFIANDGTGSPTVGNYKFSLMGKNKRRLKYGTGRLTGFPRKREGPWSLLASILKQVYSVTGVE